MNWQALKTYALQRLSERSTWLGMVAFATAAGVSLSPEQVEHIASLGASLAGAILVFSQDKPKPPVILPTIIVEKAP